MHYFRASRWRFLIAPVKRVPLRDVVLLNWIGFFAIFALPLRLGELARPALTKLRHGIPISVGLGTVAVERVIDGLITSAVRGVGAARAAARADATTRSPRALPTYGYAALLLFTCAFIALGMFLWQRELAMTLTRLTLGKVSPALAQHARDQGRQRRRRHPLDRRRAAGARASCSSRCCTGAATRSACGCSASAAGLPMQLGHAAAVMGVLAIGILLPTGPGLFGNFQLAVSAALRLYFAESAGRRRRARCSSSCCTCCSRR